MCVVRVCARILNCKNITYNSEVEKKKKSLRKRSTAFQTVFIRKIIHKRYWVWRREESESLRLFIFLCTPYQFYFHPSTYNCIKRMHNVMHCFLVSSSMKAPSLPPHSPYAHYSPAHHEHAFSHPKRTKMHNSTPLPPPLLPMHCKWQTK